MTVGTPRPATRLDEPTDSTPGPTDDAEPLAPDVSATLYLRSSASPPAKRRQSATRDRFDALADASVLPDATVRGWDRRADDFDVDETHALELYDEFADAVGTDGHLDPFFRETSSGFGDRSVVLPVLCLVVRRDDAVTGLYPCWYEGTHWSVEDGLRALETGSDAENLR